MKTAIELFLCLLFLSFNVLGQEKLYTLSKDSLVNLHASDRRIYHTSHTVNRPRIDGRLDDLCWISEGQWQGGFVQQVPDQGKEPSQQTEVNILYDENNLYVAVRCYDNEPDKISPIMGRRDDFTSGDVAGIALDTYFDRQTAFEFNITAAGQKIDLMHIGAYRWDTNWNAVWEGKAGREDSAWCAEFEIPFSQLRYDEKEKQVWGMHIWRWIDRLDEEDQWKLIPIDAPAMVYIFGELHGIENIKKKRHVEMLPFSAARYIKDNKTDRFGIGLDGKVGLTSNFTLDYTLFPDFGQVEADPSELNLTTYEVFYDEKRPFFMEGNSILDYSIGNDMLFYSRRIGHAPVYQANSMEGETVQQPSGTTILNALKVTGKNKNGLSVGIVNSMTSKEYAEISSPGASRRESVEPFTNYFVGRVSQDFNNRNTVLGGMVTSTLRSIREEHLEFLPQSALVGGIDLLHQWKNKVYFVDVKSFYSQINGSERSITRLQRSTQHLYQRTNANHLELDPTKTVMDGWGGQIKGGKQSGNFRASATLSWRSPGVDLNDLGYQRDADLIIQRANLRYQVNKPKGIIRSWYTTFEQRHDWTFGRENINDHFNLHGYLKFNNLWSVHLDGVRNLGKTDTRQLRGGPSLRMNPYSASEIFVQTNSANRIFVGAGVYKRWMEEEAGNITDFTLHLQWKISNRFSLTSNSSFERLTDKSQYVTQVKTSTDTTYVVGEIHRKTLVTTLRAEYFITPELSLQFYGSPYASVGHYPVLRQVSHSLARDFNERFSPLLILESDNEKVSVDQNFDGNFDFAIANPNFNFREFRSNFVLRWEYKAGSTFYFVWSHNRSLNEYGRQTDILDSFAGIPDVMSENVFMVKLSYWLSL